MSDILEDMRWLLERLKADGDPDGDYRERKVAMAAIAEIERSRAFIASLRPELCASPASSHLQPPARHLHDHGQCG